MRPRSAIVSNKARQLIASNFHREIVREQNLQDHSATGTSHDGAGRLSRAVASTHESITKRISEASVLIRNEDLLEIGVEGMEDTMVATAAIYGCGGGGGGGAPRARISQQDRHHISFACSLIWGDVVSQQLKPEANPFRQAPIRLTHDESVGAALRPDFYPSLKDALRASDLHWSACEQVFVSRELDMRAWLPDAASMSRLKDDVLMEYFTIESAFSNSHPTKIEALRSLSRMAKTFTNTFWESMRTRKKYGVNQESPGGFAASKCLELWKAHTASEHQVCVQMYSCMLVGDLSPVSRLH